MTVLIPRIDNLMNDLFVDLDLGPRLQNQRCGQINISTFDDRHEISVAAPGVKKNDFNVSLDNGNLLISYKASSKEELKSCRFFTKSAFSKTFKVCKNTSPGDISAKYDSGILTVSVAKPSEEVTSIHAIEIS